MGAVIAAASALTASGQTAPGPGQPATTEANALAPVLCYEAAQPGGMLTSSDAVRLCMGAVSDAPARCFSEASGHGSLSNLQAVTLCAMATSTEPADCARRLEETTNLSPTTIVQYCAANRWPAAASPDGGTPACMEAALDRTSLSQADAFRLCAGSPSDAPVTCFAWGQDRLTITDADLITLCAPLVVAQPEASGVSSMHPASAPVIIGTGFGSRDVHAVVRSDLAARRGVSPRR